MPRTVAMPAPPRRSGLSRRGLLVLGAAAAAGSGVLSGCDFLAPTRGGRQSTDQHATDPDDALVGQAVVALTAAVTQVRRTTRRHPGLRTKLAPVLALHTAHLDALRPDSSTSAPTATSAPTPTAPPVRVPRRSAAALAALADGKRALHARLTGLALDARSGDLARLLGAIAAGTRQRLAAWPA